MRTTAVTWGVVFLIAGVATGCGGEEAGSGADGEPAVEERIFAEGTGDDECAVLTLDDVTAATGLTAAEIEQREISGCHYSWDDGMIWMRRVRVHESVDRAKAYHARFTEDVSSEEVAEAKEQVKDELRDREAAGEMTSDEAAVGSAVTEAMPEWDYEHTSLPGIGSEAVYDGRGTVYIRWGNLTTSFSGKTGDEDRIEGEVATEVGRRVVANLGEM